MIVYFQYFINLIITDGLTQSLVPSGRGTDWSSSGRSRDSPRNPLGGLAFSEGDSGGRPNPFPVEEGTGKPVLKDQHFNHKKYGLFLSVKAEVFDDIEM